MKRIRPLFTCIVLAWFVIACGCNEKKATESAPLESVPDKVTRHHGLWIQDEPMLQNSVPVREAFKLMSPDNRRKFLAATPISGFLFSEGQVHLREAMKKPELHSSITSAIDKNGDIQLKLLKESSSQAAPEGDRMLTLSVKVDGDLLTLRPLAPRGPAATYRRCDSACETKMDAGERILFPGI